MIWFLIYFGLLNAADGWTTWQIFRFGGWERNDAVAWLISKVGLYNALLIMKVSPPVIIWLLNYFLPIPVWVVAAIDAMYTIQIYWNWQQLQKHKGK